MQMKAKSRSGGDVDSTFLHRRSKGFTKYSARSFAEVSSLVGSRLITSASFRLSRIHAVEDAIKARLGSVFPGGMAVPAVLSDRDGRDPRTAGRLPVPPWPRANSLTK
jgi:hypothetical protein